MKDSLKRYATLCAAGAAVLLAAASCGKTPVPGGHVPEYGEEVIFNLKDGGSAIGTKASYSGITNEGKEIIRWELGDMVRIWCAQCSEPTPDTYGAKDHWADYVAGSRYGEGDGNGISISVNPGTVGLRWGDPDTPHHFYGMFPSPTKTRKEGDSFGEGGTAVLTGSIQQNQGYLADLHTESKDGKTMTEARPDMKDMYMVGKTDITPSSGIEDKTVLIKYQPLTTALQFTIAKDTELVEEVQWVAIESASHPLYGVFTSDLAGTWSTPEGYTGEYPSCVLSGSKPEGASRLTIDFSGKGAQIGKDKALRFTFLILPLSGSGNVIDDLTFYINKKPADGSASATTIKTELKRTDGATAEANKIKFPTHKKHYITGLFVPDSAQWTVSFDPKVTPWGDNAGGSADAEEMYFLTFTTTLEEWQDVPSGELDL